MSRIEIKQGRARSPLLTPPENPSKKNHSLLRPLVIAWQGISNAIKGVDGVRNDFRNLYDLRLTRNLDGEVDTIKGETDVQIEKRLQSQFGKGLFYRFLKELHYYS